MSTNLQLSIPPGFYLEPQVASWVLGSGVDYVVFNQGGAPPAISKYIAYDTLTPANPFIAVTQDGTGNVVYDGGFPKLYNTYAPAAGATFAQLSGAFKFVHNALKWIANPDKVAAGNNKILVLGDGIANYNIKGTGPNDFKTSIDRICAIAGFVPTYKHTVDYAGGLLDPRLAELNQYCAVFLMSSLPGQYAQITNQGCTDLASFRSQGNGLFVMTDHGEVVTSAAQAANLTSSGNFFATANKVIVQFGAWFSGNYDRVPVNVGYIRANYGDHPLYAGMTNAEDIAAGGSESKVVVAEYTKYYPGNMPTVTINKSGSSVVQAAALMHDGSIETYRGFFAIAEGNPLVFKNGAGAEITALDLGYGARLSAVNLITSLSGAGTVLGEIRRGTVKIGSFFYTDELGTTVIWYANTPDQVMVKNGEALTAQIVVPFSYGTSLAIKRIQPSIGDGDSYAEIVSKAMGATDKRVTEAGTAGILLRMRAAGAANIPIKLSTAENVQQIRNSFYSAVMDGRWQPVVQRAIYPTEAAADYYLKNAQVPGGTHNRVVLIVETNNLYQYVLGTWEKVAGTNLAEIFGVGRVIESTLGGQQYRVSADGKLIAL